MLTQLTVRNFKRFGNIDIDLGDPVVFIGPNNSGKTSAMQALALWNIGVKRWHERRGGAKMPEKRPGVTVNRRDLVSIPVPTANLLWRALHTRNVYMINGRQQTENIRIEIIVKGVSGSSEWECGIEFDYANEESFYCRPLRLGSEIGSERMPIPEEAVKVDVAFLPPMSGLTATETRLDPGAINVRVGEGRTAEVLRNLCFRIHTERPHEWEKLKDQIEELFGAQLVNPRYIDERGEITMSYREGDSLLDLTSSGRGLQQTLLIFAYMYANPGSILLLDEPDAHLEILRQRQIYHLISEVAAENRSQIIAASHSEVLLNEAAGRDSVVAFVGQPHRIDRGSQVLKALQEIGFEQYIQAEQTGWVLYLEGSTDLAILQAFARRLDHERALEAFERPFVHYVGNQLSQAHNHYYGLKEAVSNLKGIAILDEIPPVQPQTDFIAIGWNRREIENYLCSRATLETYAEETARQAVDGPLFAPNEIQRRLSCMSAAIEEVEKAMATLELGSPWDDKAKVSDEFLSPVFASYFKRLSLPNQMRKGSFYELAQYVPEAEIDAEISEKLDAIALVAGKAEPAVNT